MKPLFEPPVKSAVLPWTWRRCGERSALTREQALQAAEAEEAARLQAEQDAQREQAVDEAVAANDAAWGSRMTAAIEQERTAIQQACAGVAAAQAQFFRDAQVELARLALELAGKVLGTRLNEDALAVSAAVHQVLRQLSPDDRPTLFVPAIDADGWRSWSAQTCAVEVQADMSLRRGECRLVSHAGTADLGVGAQLACLQSAVTPLLGMRTSC